MSIEMQERYRSEPMVEIDQSIEEEVTSERLSRFGVRFLSGFVTTLHLKTYTLTPEMIDQLSAGVARLRGPVRGNEVDRNYQAIVAAYIHEDGSVAKVNELLSIEEGRESRNAGNVIRALRHKCMMAAPNGVTLQQLLEMGHPEYEPRVSTETARALGGAASVSFVVESQPSWGAAILFDDAVQQRTEDEYSSRDPLEWRGDGLCAQTDPEAFFPEVGGSTRAAKQICTSCEVRNICLRYALENDESYGIWGGLSERERRKLKKESNPR